MKRNRFFRYIYVSAFLLCAGLAHSQSDTVLGTFSVKTETLLTLEKGEEGECGDFSTDGRHFGMTIKHKDSYCMWYDGTRGSNYWAVFPPVFSPDGSLMAYLVLSSDEYYYVILDSSKLGPFTWFIYDDVEHELVFSNDSKRFAFRTANLMSNASHPCFVFCDSAMGKRYNSFVGPPPAFSQDGKRLVYFARDGKDWFAVLDGIPGKRFVRTGSLTGFSADGSIFCYRGQDKDSMFYVAVNDTTYGPYWRLLSVKCSPVGSELAWSASGDSTYADTLFINGQSRATHDRIWDITYSNDGTQMAYVAMDKDSFSLVVGDKISAKYRDVTCFHFSPDGKHFAYAAHLWPDGSKTTVMMDSLPLYTYRSVIGITFSPDGSRLASVVELKPGKFAVVVDGAVGPLADSVKFVRFSPDSKSCYYMVKRGGNYIMVQNGIEGIPYRRISYDVAIDSVTNKLIYFAAKKKDEHLFVIDGHETGTFDYIFGITLFTPQGSVIAFAERDRKVYRLTISPMR